MIKIWYWDRGETEEAIFFPHEPRDAFKSIPGVFATLTELEDFAREIWHMGKESEVFSDVPITFELFWAEKLKQLKGE